ncbi:MAG: tetratricopeptide repeat protein [Planctomycetes bacterium]|nr:tetratricopeptide repeat protein [Planctomycetota bacterium]
MSTVRSATGPKKIEERTSPIASSGEQILSNAQSSRDVVQDFVPLAESLEWELGQEYLKERGNKAFISDASPVPFVINNDGTLSRNAATVFFESLLAADKAGTLEPEIFVLELGIGVGLFARYFLDHFRELCLKNQKDFYDRFTYVAADRSERMLLDVLRHGVLAHHPGHYRVRMVDALEPQDRLPGDACFLNHSGKPFRAVFLNYLLDCLPAAVLEIDGDSVKQLHVRTCVARNVKLDDFTDMSVDALKDRALSANAAAKRELLEVYGLFASEYDYRPVKPADLPHWEFVQEFRRHGKRLLHSYGAIQSLERLLALVHDQGFILINDYGQTMLTRDDEFEHQRFSLATFVGVNFPLLKAFFKDEKKLQWLEPSGESKGIHTRLLAHTTTSELRVIFQQVFNEHSYKELQEPILRARECAKVGRFELAATYYREALEKQPRNWVLLNEISMFLTFSLRDPKAGSDMAKLALGLNPTLSAELWNTLGDSLYEFGRTAEARSVYLKALDVNATDVRSRYNLAWTYTREKNYPAALDMISQATALDKTGEFRERLLQKQQEVLNHLAMRHQQEYLRIINLVSKYAKKEEKDKQAGPAETPIIKDSTND